jgi:acetylornithine/N-succinyldiaminopimelate aminotransferase
MKKQDIFQSYSDYIMPTYTKMPYIFVKAKGSKIVDIDGKVYLDFFPGWGVGNIGHCHPSVQCAIRDQVSKMIHLPNNFYHPAQARLAEEIIRHSFDGKVFLCNSGAEANEAAIKLARAYGAKNFATPRYEIVTFENAFHGRTLATITATGQAKYQKGFEPLVEGFVTNTPLNDLEALKKVTGPKTVGIMLELVQGEGGIQVAKPEFVAAVRKLCDENKWLLIFDEVQTGIGRLGTLFGFQHYGVKPDIMTLAKSLGGGLPVGCMVAKKEIADILSAGMHASTFGGGAVVSKAALGVFKAIKKDKMLANVKKMSPYLFEKLNALKAKHPSIQEVRGVGLMVGVELNRKGKDIVEKCLEKGLLINCTHETVLRLMPALNVTKRQIDTAIHILDKVFQEVRHAG